MGRRRDSGGLAAAARTHIGLRPRAAGGGRVSGGWSRFVAWLEGRVTRAAGGSTAYGRPATGGVCCVRARLRPIQSVRPGTTGPTTLLAAASLLREADQRSAAGRTMETADKQEHGKWGQRMQVPVQSACSSSKHLRLDASSTSGEMHGSAASTRRILRRGWIPKEKFCVSIFAKHMYLSHDSSRR